MNNCWRALLLFTLKTLFVSFAFASCPQNQYYEPHKGCRSCDNVCLGAENSDECRFHCSNYGNDDKTFEGNDDDQTDGIEPGRTSLQIAPANVVTPIVITVLVLVLVAAVVGILWYRSSNRRLDGREGFRTMRLVRNSEGEFVLEEEPNAQSQTSISQIYSDQGLLTDSLLRSGSEEGMPVAGPAVNREPDNTSTADSHEEDVIGTRSSFHTSTVAGPRTHGSITEINNSDHKTEFDKKVLRSHDSTTTRRQECPTLSSQNNTSSRLVVNDNNSSNDYPFHPGETLLKSPFTTASPDSDQFSVDAAMGVRVTGYSQEATTERNSQPALKSPASLRAYLSPTRINLTNHLGIDLVNEPSSSYSGQLSDYQSTLLGDSSEDTISSDGSVSTDQDDPVST